MHCPPKFLSGIYSKGFERRKYSKHSSRLFLISTSYLFLFILIPSWNHTLTQSWYHNLIQALHHTLIQAFHKNLFARVNIVLIILFIHLMELYTIIIYHPQAIYIVHYSVLFPTPCHQTYFLLICFLITQGESLNTGGRGVINTKI